MLKKLAFPLAFVALSGPAFAQDTGVYGQLSLYGVHVDEEDGLDIDFGFGVGGSVGYAFDNGFRAEGEIAYRRNDFDIDGSPADGDFNTYAFMANAIYDFQVDAKFQPYIGAGLGIVHGEANINYGSLSGEIDETELGYQALVGVSYHLFDRGAVVFGYRYFGTGGDIDLDTHNVELGYRFKF